MKSKILLAAMLAGATTLSAQAGICFGFSVGVPLPVVVVPTPVAVVTPVVVSVPPCPAPGYVWVPGYWSGYGATRCWIAGSWRGRPGYGDFGHFYGHSYADSHAYGWHH
jgi:hypothetical protein